MKKKERLFDRTSLLLLISVVMINVICIITVSYAYFTTQIKGNDVSQPIEVVMGTMKIKYEDSDLVTLDNAMPGDYLTNKFRITNEGNLDANYNLKIDIIENNFRDKGDLEYTLRRNGEPVDNGTLPYTDGYILVNQTITTGGVDNYELEVKFKEDLVDKNQNDNKNRKLDFKIVVDSNETAEKYVYKPLYKDNSGANIPELYQGLIPIYYNESNQIVIADVTKEWYNYDAHEWANAVLIDHTNKDIINKFYNEDGTLRKGDIITTDDILQMYVWIPRYKYQLFNVEGNIIEPQMINIEFEIGEDATGNVTCETNNLGEETCKNANNGEWYTHPAFTFGNTELDGIWIGKFEPSHTTKSKGNNSTDDSAALNCTNNNCSEANFIKIVPNAVSLRYNNVSNFFYVLRSIEKVDNKYNLDTSEIDTHMMKNIEWGVMTYLTQSKYGRCEIDGGCIEVTINGNENFLTGYADSTSTWETTEGQLASTTGNIYGIYDTSGGAWDDVMGVITDADGSDINYYSSEFTKDTKPDRKYYDLYKYDINDLETQSRGHLGDATKETLSWYDDHIHFINATTPWFERGEEYPHDGYAGIFCFHHNTGLAHRSITTRSVLTAQDGAN